MAVVFLALASRSHAQDLKAGEPFRDCPHCPEMVVVPAGSFLMGSSEADTKRILATVPRQPNDFSINKLLGLTEIARAKKFLAYEHPQHRVTILHEFALGKYLVTTGEFATFVGETGYRTASCAELIGNGFSNTIGPAWQDPGFADES